MEGGVRLAAGIPTRLTAREGRKFGLTVGAAFLVLSGLLWWRGHPEIRNVLGAVGILLLLAGIMIPTRLGTVNRAWMGLAHLLSKVTTPIFMGVVYFLVILPIGVILRMVGKRPLTHPIHEGGYWHTRPTSVDRHSDMTRQF